MMVQCKLPWAGAELWLDIFGGFSPDRLRYIGNDLQNSGHLFHSRYFWSSLSMVNVSNLYHALNPKTHHSLDEELFVSPF